MTSRRVFAVETWKWRQRGKRRVEGMFNYGMHCNTLQHTSRSLLVVEI